MQILKKKLKNGKFNIHSRKNVADFWLEFWDWRTVQRSALCRSRRELSNEYLVAKIGYLGLFSFFFERDRSTLLACLLACLRRYSRERAPRSLGKMQFIIHLPPDLLRTRRDQVVLSPLEEIWGTLLTKQAQSIAPKKSKNAANYRDWKTLHIEKCCKLSRFPIEKPIVPRKVPLSISWLNRHTIIDLNGDPWVYLSLF